MDINVAGPFMAIIVTCLGFILSVVCILFIAFGTKMAAQADQPHKIKFKGFEVQTDRIVMLLIVCVLAMILPLGGYYWLTYKVFHDAQLHLIATIEEKPGIFATEAEVLLVRVEPDQEQKQCPDKKLINGMFSCRSRLKSLSDVFELRVQRTGIRGKIIPISPTEHNILVTLEGER